jgi:hypothetical protein
MSKESLEENKGRWFLFEQVSPARSALLWTAAAVVVVLGVLYFAI